MSSADSPRSTGPAGSGSPDGMPANRPGRAGNLSGIDQLPGVDRLQVEKREYAQGQERPLGSYVALMSTYGAVVATVTAAGVLAGKRPPETVAPWDLALVSVATHKLSRLITKDSITSPVRAPFTRYQGVGGPAELTEDVRGTGLRKAVGELLTCPFCLGMWFSTSFHAGLVFAPRGTRLVASTLTALTVSDFLHFAYAQTYQAVE